MTPVTAVESPVIELFRYDAWANTQMIDACLRLTPEQLAATAPGTYGPIHNTLFHIVDGEEDYLGVITGHPPVPVPEPEQLPSIEELRERAERVGEALAQAADRLGPDDAFPRRYDGRIYSLPAVRFLAQVISHSAEHRTHVLTILGQQGLEQPEIDGWSYLHTMGLESRQV